MDTHNPGTLTIQDLLWRLCLHIFRMLCGRYSKRILCMDGTNITCTSCRPFVDVLCCSLTVSNLYLHFSMKMIGCSHFNNLSILGIVKTNKTIMVSKATNYSCIAHPKVDYLSLCTTQKIEASHAAVS